MDEQAFSTEEVIAALENVGISQEVIEYVVPILGYESRVNGVPFVNTAVDTESPSYGIGQANVDSMSPAIYMAFKELGIELPGITPEQEKQLLSNIVPDKNNNGQIDPGEDLRPFTPEQREFVINWFLNNATLNDHAMIFKHMLHQKEIEGLENDFEAIDELYINTVKKYEDPNNADAQALKTELEQSVNGYYQEPDRGIPEPEEGFTPFPLPTTGPTDTEPTRDTNTMSDYQSQVPSQAPSYDKAQYDTRINRLKESVKQSASDYPMEIPVNLKNGYEIAIDLMGRQVDKQRAERGLNPIAKPDVKNSYRNNVRQSLLDALDLLGG